MEAAGSARRMGRAHGEQAALLVQRYLTAIERWCGADRDALDRLTALVREGWGGWDVVRLARLLADHAGDPAGICRHGAGGTHSIAGYIADPARGLLHVRRGRGCTGTWTAYEV